MYLVDEVIASHVKLSESKLVPVPSFPTELELNAEKLFVSVVDMVPSRLASRIP